MIKPRKTIAIMQPDYLPGIPRFELMAGADAYVLYDTVQFTVRSWRIRNKVRIATSEGWTWLSVPVHKESKYRPICEVEIDTSSNWAQRHWKTIQQAYSKAPFFKQHRDFFEQLYQTPWQKLNELNVHVTTYLRDYLALRCDLPLLSERLHEFQRTDDKNMNLVKVCHLYEADCLIVSPATYSYINPQLFIENDIQLKLQNFVPHPYSQVYRPFVPYLSMIDLILNEPKASVLNILDKNQALYPVGPTTTCRPQL